MPRKGFGLATARVGTWDEEDSLRRGKLRPKGMFGLTASDRQRHRAIIVSALGKTVCDWICLHNILQHGIIL